MENTIVPPLAFKHIHYGLIIEIHRILNQTIILVINKPNLYNKLIFHTL